MHDRNRIYPSVVKHSTGCQSTGDPLNIIEDCIVEKPSPDNTHESTLLLSAGMHWLTLKKVLEHSEPPGYRQQQRRRKAKLGEFLKRIEEILKEDQAMPRKQRHMCSLPRREKSSMT